MQLLKIRVGHQFDVKKKLLEGLHLEIFFILGVALKNTGEHDFLILSQIVGIHLHLAHRRAGNH